MKSILLLLLLFPVLISARGTYQEPVDFVAQAFNQQAPKPAVIWVTGEVKDTVKKIMGHDLPSLRQRYWGKTGRTVWILEEIGKEKPYPPK